ncbi:uncharacterized protein LOC5508289 [Nematostella vectensis]|uniref:uncharacterized protein LOC5508289 n=1 Tax=Nematostella vectensis TaxID=45351 RepID=UPI0020773BDC|nr:uncharacterized protein LOC5508289 [Nematostella vectensis]
MAFPEETLQRIRSVMSKTFGSQNKIIIAPCMVEVYTTKTRDFLKKPSEVKWTLKGTGLLAVIHDSVGTRDRLQLCLSSAKTSEILWQETVVPFTTVDSPHPTFHTLSSTRNFQERTGILYQNKAVARLVFQVMTMFTSQRGPENKSARNVFRSKSFCVAPRPRASPGSEINHAFERSTLALSKVQVHRAFSTENASGSGPMVATALCSRGLRNSTDREIITREQISQELSMRRSICLQTRQSESSLMTTDLCTTEL